MDYNDPHIPRYIGGRHCPGWEMTSPLATETLMSTGLVLLVTDHSAYDYHWLASQVKLIGDTRNAFKGQSGKHISKA